MSITESEMESIRESIAKGLASFTDEEVDKIDVSTLNIALPDRCPLGQAKGWDRSLEWPTLLRLGFWPIRDDCDEFMTQEWIEQITMRRNARNR